MLKQIDSFDHYATADIPQKWNQSSATAQSIAAGGRRSTSCFQFTASTSINKPVPALASYVAGVAFKIDTLPSTGNDRILFFSESGTNHVSINVSSAGEIVVLRNTTVLGTSAPGVITAANFHYIEAKVTVNNSTGSYDVHVDGASVVSGSGADTQNAGTGVINQIGLQGITAKTVQFDDFYVCDLTGGVNDDFLGDVRCDCKFPTGNGNSSDLVGSDANSVDNYLLVDEASADGDTSYVESATAGDHDTYGFADLSHTPSAIYGVQVVMQARKDDAGARSIASVTRSGGADTDGATQALSTGYVMYREMLEEDPNTSAAWGVSGFNAAEFGVKVAA